MRMGFRGITAAGIRWMIIWCIRITGTSASMGHRSMCSRICSSGESRHRHRKGSSMSVEEIFSELRHLSRKDKLRAMQILVMDLASEADTLIIPGGQYEVWSPQ